MATISFRRFTIRDVERWEQIEEAFKAGRRKKGLGPVQRTCLASWYNLKLSHPSMTGMWFDGKTASVSTR
jgi:hypothetical protein